MGRELGSIQSVAPSSNKSGLEVISVTHHSDRSWLNDDAWRNIYPMSVTLEVSQPLMSLLNDDAPPNIPAMFVTASIPSELVGTEMRFEQ